MFVSQPASFAPTWVAVLACLAGCCGNSDLIEIDGSSTVYPITEAVAESFRRDHDDRIAVGVSGTGGGFRKLCSGEVTISAASRPIKQSERDLCARAGVEWIELPVAYDGIAVVVHPEADWVGQMTTTELREIWRPEAQGKLMRWKQVRPDWPERELHLFGPGVDSGTYDYFTKAIVGTEHSSRGDFTSSEDDNVLVQGVSTDLGALGFFGLAYYTENAGKLRAVGIVNPAESTYRAAAVWPSAATVADGSYQPLARPIFIYVNAAAAAERPRVANFVRYYLDHAGELAADAGYVALTERSYELAKRRAESLRTGSLFSNQPPGVDVEALLEDRP